MRADRLISLLLLLQNRGRLTAESLAGELEVSVRTIYRDITAMSAAGIPVYTTHGPGGGIHLVEEYRTSLTGLTRSQARALFMFTLPDAAAALGVSNDLQAALLKLTASLPASLQMDREQVRQRVYINMAESRQQLRKDLHLAGLYTAIWEERWVEVRYQSILGERTAPLERRVMALGLAAQGNHWFLVCQQEEVRLVIPVNRILSVKVSEQNFERPPGFDLPVFWQSWQAGNTAYHFAYPVLVRVSDSAAHLLADRMISEKSPSAPGSNRMNLVVHFEHLEEARQVLLPLGGAVEVLAPQALRLSIADYAHQIISAYKGDV